MAFPSEQELRTIVEPLASSLGLDVEAVTVTRAGAKSAVRIAVDGDSRPDLDLLEELSKAVSADYDGREASGSLNFGAGYTLELTTPGLDTPLTRLRHFRRNTGRLIAVNGENLRIAGVDMAAQSGSDSGTDAGADSGSGSDSVGQSEAGATVWLIRPAPSKKGKPLVVASELASVAGALVEVEFSDAPSVEAELGGLAPENYRALTAQEDDNK